MGSNVASASKAMNGLSQMAKLILSPCVDCERERWSSLLGRQASALQSVFGLGRQEICVQSPACCLGQIPLNVFGLYG